MQICPAQPSFPLSRSLCLSLAEREATTPPQSDTYWLQLKALINHNHNAPHRFIARTTDREQPQQATARPHNWLSE